MPPRIRSLYPPPSLPPTLSLPLSLSLSLSRSLKPLFIYINVTYMYIYTYAYIYIEYVSMLFVQVPVALSDGAAYQISCLLRLGNGRAAKGSNLIYTKPHLYVTLLQP